MKSVWVAAPGNGAGRQAVLSRNSSRATVWEAWILVTRQTRGPVKRVQIQRRAQRVLERLTRDLQIGQVDARHRDFGTRLQGLLNQVFNWTDLVLLVESQGVGGNDRRHRQHGISHVLGNGVLHQQLLELKIGLRADQVLFRRGNPALGLQQGNGSQGANPDLLLIVGERFLRQL